MIDDNPLNADFGSSSHGPSLELETIEAVPAEPPPPETPVVIETPAQVRARRIVEIAAYGRAPARIYGAPAYCFSVMLRKRVLEDELRGLSAQRKNADDAVQNAQVQLGEAIYALRTDPALAELSKLVAAVVAAQSELGQVEARSSQRQQDTERELARLEGLVANAERIAVPLRNREARAAAREADFLAKVKAAQNDVKRLDAELEALQRPKSTPDPARRDALRAERDARHGDLQTIAIKLRPVQDELAAAREELAGHLRTIANLHAERQSADGAVHRAQQSHRLSSGSARGDRKRALVALAIGAFKQGLTQACTPHAEALESASAHADALRGREELHRAAVRCYDHKVYGRGLAILLGGSGLLLLSMLVMIIF
jgi:hypothetical protein